MQVKPLGRVYLVRLEPGEEVIASLTRFADVHRIGFATLQAIGTFMRVTLGYYEAETQVYRKEILDKQVEVLNLTGNIARDENGECVIHTHVTLGHPDYTTRGGHVVEASVGPTLEVVVTAEPVTIRRRHDPDVGLQLWDLESPETFAV